MNERVGVVGIGFLGRGIAACLLSHEFSVTVYDPKLDESVARDIDTFMAELIERASFPKSILSQWRERYRIAGSLKVLTDCDFVIESVSENIEVKLSVFAELEDVIRPDVPLTSNTSAIPISLMQKSLKHPERFAGMHWAGPAHASRFLEVIRGDQTNDATIDAVMKLATRSGKDPALLKRDIEGFIINRLCYAMYREALHLVEIGVADYESIDRCWRNVIGTFAAIAGPFQWMDLTGTALYAAGMRRIWPTLSNSTEIPEIMKKLEAENAMGTKNGHGFYNYTPEEAERLDKQLREETWRARNLQEGNK